MAAMEGTKTEVAGDDDDAWLYGDEGKEEKESTVESQDKAVVPGDKNGSAPEKKSKKDDREEGEMSGEEGESQEKADDDDSDDDDDDNVQVTIGDIKAWSVTEQPRNLFKSGTNYQKPASGTVTKPAATSKGIDLEAQGTINGVPVYEFDINSIENDEKPWRKPGADITDYFNYGFNEEKWQKYCEIQRRLIAMNDGGAVKTIGGMATVSDKDLGDKFLGLPAVSSRIRPQPAPKAQVGAIAVIGGTATDSRRPDEGDPIPVAGAPAHLQARKFLPVPGLPPTSIPPPHIPPVDYSIPPPGLPPPHGVPPPGMSVPPPGFPPVPDPFDPFYGHGVPPPPNRALPPPGFEDRPPFNYGPSHPPFSNTFSDSSRPGSQQWESGSGVMAEQESREQKEWERERERRDSMRRERERSPHRPEEEYNNSREMKYRNHDREREREREVRERDRGDRDRDRERDRDRKRDRDRRRSRSTDRDRDAEGSRRDRDEEKYRSRRSDSRRHKGDDSDTESRSTSKHKKSRRRRDRDDDAAESLAGDETPKAD